MIKFLSQLLDLIYKKRCYFCGSTKNSTKMCEQCYNKIELLSPKILKYIESRPVYSATIYEDEIRRLIKGLKYHNQRELAYFQAKVMFEYWQKLSVSSEKFVIVPVPLFKKRQKKRKYNHMSLVAEEFSKMTGYEINENLIIRIKETKPQFNLKIHQRTKNMENAFFVKEENYSGQKLLIIDDILTTGATLSEMIRTFKHAEINNITAFVTSCTDFHIN